MLIAVVATVAQRTAVDHGEGAFYDEEEEEAWDEDDDEEFDDVDG